MKKRILAVFLAAAAMMCSLCACNGTTSNAERVSDEITVGIAQDLDNSLDPYQMTAAGTREVMFNVFEGLVKPDADGNYVCAVASEYSVSDDGLVYTFTLRDNVVFHNGAVCSADDVLYSFETCAATTVTSAVKAALRLLSLSVRRSPSCSAATWHMSLTPKAAQIWNSDYLWWNNKYASWSMRP